MNILFINYGTLATNSMSHIAAYANEFAKCGHSCAVAVERDNNDEHASIAVDRSRHLFTVFDYESIKAGAEAFPDAKPAEIIHAWTPRENVRVLTEAYTARFPQTKVVIHLEDNEDAILESAYQRPIDQLRHPYPDQPEPAWHGRLSHPTAYKRFLAQADGVTLLANSLKKLLPTPKPHVLIRPIVDFKDYEKPVDRAKLIEKYNLPKRTRLITFPGGITSSNRSDVRALYLAVKLLNDEGLHAKIIKTGPSCSVFESSFEFPIEDIAVDLGYIDSAEIPKLISIADVLIQPGQKNDFNRDRFPCKIPEYLASGRPTIIPSMYREPDYKDQPYCLFLEESSPREIANMAMTVFQDSELSGVIGLAGQNFAQKSFSPSQNCEALLTFYQEVSNIPTSSPRDEYQSNNLREENNLLKSKLSIFRAKESKLLDTIESNKQEKEDLQNKLDLAQGRIERMSKSVSWWITQPLRFLRRNLFDSFKKPPEEAFHSKRTPVDHPSRHKNYHEYIPQHEKRIQEYVTQYNADRSNKCEKIRFSIILPVYEIEEKWLKACIDSVVNQVYQNWELCIADDCSPSNRVQKTLKEYAQKDPRIKVVYRDQNGHISRASNSALSVATGEYVALLDHDDELTPHALSVVAEQLQNTPKAKIIYSDEDKIDANNLRHGPHFKSDWNYDLFLGCNMISHLGVYKRESIESVGGFRTGFEGAQDWDLALRISEICDETEIVHIPEILYHWRSIEGSTADSLSHKDYASNAQRKAIADHLSRRGIEAKLESVDGNHWRVIYKLPEIEPRVSIIVPSKNRTDLLKTCIESILTKTKYKNFEIVVVDNNSSEQDSLKYLSELESIQKVRVLKDSSRFNYSAINNRAIATCESELICLLNNDTEVIEPDWLREMASHAIRTEIGVVGAKLLFPHNHVQHGGVIMGIGGVAAHAFKFLHKDDDGHLSRAKLVSRYSATTGACMTFRKSLWKELNGLDEINLPISYNDVDFCLRAGERGYHTIVSPFSLLYHKESESRGDSQSADQIEHFNKERDYMYSKWNNKIQNDPYYNPNLTIDREDFSYRQLQSGLTK